LKLIFLTPHLGQTHSGGRSAKAVPGAIPFSSSHMAESGRIVHLTTNTFIFIRFCLLKLIYSTAVFLT